MFRPTFRILSRPATASRLSKQTARRGFASEKPGDVSHTDTSRPVSPTSRNRLPFILLAGVIFFGVAGRYFVASNKPAASGQAEIKEARRNADPSKEYRDPRDSGVKTLEQKRQKEQNEKNS